LLVYSVDENLGWKNALVMDQGTFASNSMNLNIYVKKGNTFTQQKFKLELSHHYYQLFCHY